MEATEIVMQQRNVGAVPGASPVSNVGAVPGASPVSYEELVAEIMTRLQSLDSLKAENIRTVRREFSKRLSNTEPQVVLEVSQRLINEEKFASRLVAYELVCNHRAALRSLGEKELEQLGRGIDSWEDVDTFACYLSGPTWRERQVADEVIFHWAHSENRWWRRAALVSTVPLNTRARGGKGDTARTLDVCRMLVRDRDDMVVKAMSWALRELVIWDAEAVQQFLEEYKEVLAARVVREVRNKLTTGLKNPRR
jgi:3-methyladenine DNA glycosylase AlkD